MGIRLVIASIPQVGDVQKAPIIQIAALYCIFQVLYKDMKVGYFLRIIEGIHRV